jgi:hypothetical protein
MVRSPQNLEPQWVRGKILRNKELAYCLLDGLKVGCDIFPRAKHCNFYFNILRGMSEADCGTEFALERTS